MAENQGETQDLGDQSANFDSWLEPPVGSEPAHTPPSNGGVPPLQSEVIPVQTGQGEPPAQGQGNELFKPSDFGAYENWDEVKKAYASEPGEDPLELGENVDPKEIAKSYANLRSKMTQQAQEISELRKAQTEIQRQPLTPLPPPASALSAEELQELWTSDPSRAAVETLKANPQLLAEALGSVPGFERLVKAADRVEANEMLGNLRGEIKDF